MKAVSIGLLGMGTVGGGTVNVLARNQEEISRRAGRGIQVVSAFVRDMSRPRICATDGIRLGTDPWAVVNDAHVEVVVELMGGTELARELVLAAIASGKHVVTANKALIALHGNEIFQAAQNAGVTVAFEAAVAGGIPIIKAIREGLAGNRIEWLAGIINGTGNYILTAMREQGRAFDDVLAEAQALGYAEQDPAFDVDGIDAAHKLAILGSIAFGKPLEFDKLIIEGIRPVSQLDVQFAEQLGYRIKHLGIARRRDDGVELRVHPTLIPERCLLAAVNGVMNAVLVKGDAVGATMYYGAGAGAEATASAVVADVVDVVRALTTDPGNRVPHLAFQPEALSAVPVLEASAIESAYYLRMTADDQPGVLAEVAGMLGRRGISIEAVVQKEPQPGATQVPLIMLTHRVREGLVIDAINDIEASPHIGEQVMRLRVETLDGA
jgi:homoserine dehydrogenase